MDEIPENVKQIIHRGKRVKVKWLGGESHGQEGALRRPIKPVTETAAPSRYLGNNFYDANVGNLKYDQYHLRAHGEDLYYVHKDWLDEFPANIDKEYETTNQRLIREELEHGGPMDLVEGKDTPLEIKEFMNQNLVGRCNKCLRPYFVKERIGEVCYQISNDQPCMGTIKPIEEFAKKESKTANPISRTTTKRVSREPIQKTDKEIKEAVELLLLWYGNWQGSLVGGVTQEMNLRTRKFIESHGEKIPKNTFTQ